MIQEVVLIFLYKVFSVLIYPLIPIILKKRIKKGKEDPSRYKEKMGLASIQRPSGKLVWINAASVGEVKAVLPLLQILSENGINVLLTSASLTSYLSIQNSLPNGVIHQFLPVDSIIYAKRFVKYWQPNVAVFIEGELLYNLLECTKKSGAKLMFVNARFSDKSRTKWQKAKGFLTKMLGLFDDIYVYDDVTGVFIENMGIKVIKKPNIKYDIKLPTVNKIYQKPNKPLICVLSTHEKEEEVIFLALKQVKKTHDFNVVLIPRHPKRTPEICKILDSIGFDYVLNSQSLVINGVYIVDAIGKVFDFLPICDFVIMGGSFVSKFAGHNVLEPALLGKPVINGPFYGNFKQIVEQMQSENAIIVTNDLVKDVSLLLTNPDLVAKIGQQAYLHLNLNRGSSQYFANKIIKELK